MALILPHSAFVHVPKTGGTWVRLALEAAAIPRFESGPAEANNIGRAHAYTRVAWPTIMVKDWRNDDLRPVRRYVFGFVRNPYAWLESIWADAFEHGRAATRVLTEFEKKQWRWRCHDPSFEKWIDNVLEVKPAAPSDAMLGRLGYEHVDGRWRRGKYIAHFIGRQENLVEDLLHALRIAGEKFDERVIRRMRPQRVSGQLPKWREQMHWRDDQRAAVRAANEQLFRRFYE